MDAASVFSQLREGRVPVSQLQVVPLHGVYALFLHESSSLGTFPIGTDGLIYIGKTSDLEARSLNTHFSPKDSGFSSPRRSFGAILKDDLRLKAKKRGKSLAKSNFVNYIFTPDGERRLSLWIEGNLHVSAIALSPGIETAMEESLFEIECPVLNLKKCNPFNKKIRELRKICANEARRSAGVEEK